MCPKGVNGDGAGGKGRGTGFPGQSQAQGAGQTFSVANSAGGGTDRLSSRGDRPGTAAGGEFFLRVDVEGEVGRDGQDRRKEDLSTARTSLNCSNRPSSEFCKRATREILCKRDTIYCFHEINRFS